jgi:ribosomal-protein-alanine N-acetyltransferase
MRRPVDPPPEAPVVTFRRAELADVTRVVEIEREGFRHPWSRELIERELAHAWSLLLLAEEGCAVLGYIVFWIVHDEVHVLNVATALSARRRGIGRALMLEAEREGARRGARLCTLEVRRSNTPALELYRELGYRQVGIRPNYYAEEREDAIVMVKALG